MPDPDAEAVPVPLSVLREGAEKTFDNAERLFREAEILAASGATARGLCLHQISLEECAKVDTLGAWAVSQVLGDAVDGRTILRALSRHSAKNKANAYFLEVSDEELDARTRGDLAGANAAFRALQERFHITSNHAKNASLYVDWDGQGFVAPADRVTVDMLAEIKAGNAEFLGYAWNHVQALRRLETQTEAVTELLTGLTVEAERLRDEKPEDRIQALEALLADFLDQAKAELGERSATGEEPPEVE